MLFVASLAAIPEVQLNNGVALPMISLGTWQYSPEVAEQTVSLGLSLGFNHIDTALDYKNQEAVGKALAPHNRSSYFLTTKIPPQMFAKTAYANAMKDLDGDLAALGLDYVDLMLVHFPPKGNTLFCAAMQEQWRAMEDFYKAKKARAIGVSNYCQSSFECILKTANVTPAVNQIQFHVGMSPDPSGIKSYADQHKIVTQSYSPLGDGTTELINGPCVQCPPPNTAPTLDTSRCACESTTCSQPGTLVLPCSSRVYDGSLSAWSRRSARRTTRRARR